MNPSPDLALTLAIDRRNRLSAEASADGLIRIVRERRRAVRVARRSAARTSETRQS
jgi:hypothetical protein